MCCMCVYASHKPFRHRCVMRSNSIHGILKSNENAHLLFKWYTTGWTGLHSISSMERLLIYFTQTYNHFLSLLFITFFIKLSSPLSLSLSLSPSLFLSFSLSLSIYIYTYIFEMKREKGVGIWRVYYDTWYLQQRTILHTHTHTYIYIYIYIRKIQKMIGK